MADAGHEVRRVVATNSRRRSGALKQIATSTWDPVANRAVGQMTERFRPDVVHVHNTWYALAPSILRSAKRAGPAVVVTLHNYRTVCSNAALFRDGHTCEDCVGSHAWHGVRHRCYRASAMESLLAATNIEVHARLSTWTDYADRLLVLSEFAASRFRAAGMPADRLLVKPNFVPDGPSRTDPPGDSRTVLFVGRLTREKGLEVLLEAWKEVHTDLGDLRLAIVGSGPLKPALEQRGLPPGVTFLGHLSPEAVRIEMAQARALVFPSLCYEGAAQPLVVMEALAAQLPVLASAHGDLDLVPRRLYPTFGVEPGRVNAWSAALRSLLDSDVIGAAGRRARRIYEAEFTPASGLQRLESAYREALKMNNSIVRTPTAS